MQEMERNLLHSGTCVNKMSSKVSGRKAEISKDRKQKKSTLNLRNLGVVQCVLRVVVLEVSSNISNSSSILVLENLCRL
ncbi:unnamed protein product [Camellia sinensis]